MDDPTPAPWSRPRIPSTDVPSRHQAAVNQSLSWAKEAAARGDYADALSWMQTLDAVGYTFAEEDHDARVRWQTASSTQAYRHV